MKKLILFLSFSLVFSACRIKEKAVNQDYDVYIPVGVPLGGGPQGELNRPSGYDISNQALGLASASAIEGKVILAGDIPLPLSRVQLALFKKDDANRWTELTRITTSSEGQFRFTQKLGRGNYELRIVDKKYEGIQTVQLADTPARGLIVQVTQKK